MNLYKKIRKFNILVLGILLIVSLQVSRAAEGIGFLKIYFLDVGQGDSIFIETPSGNQILVDGGPDNKVLSELGKVMPFYDRTIDIVLVSHPHADHIAGLTEVVNKYEVGKVVEAKEIYDSPQFIAWEQNASNIFGIEATAGKSLKLDKDLSLIILHPFQSVSGAITKSPHDDSVVSMLQYKNFRVLLTGDMETSLENKLILGDVDLDADILKIGHHGSKTSTSDNFLKEVTPEVGVIEVGADNKYSHPSIEILSRLENFKIPYYRTDINGTIKVVSDGTTFSVSKEK